MSGVRRVWKSVVTFDTQGLGAAMTALWGGVVEARGKPDVIVGIATGGVICAETLRDVAGVPILSCAMRRPGTEMKSRGLVPGLLPRLPYVVTNSLRRVEDLLLEWRQGAVREAKIPAASAQLISDIEAVAREVEAKRLSHVLVVDDAVDSGTTLACVIAALKAALPGAPRITSAVVTQTRPTAALVPDVTLYTETLCRFPWSFDFHGRRYGD